MCVKLAKTLEYSGLKTGLFVSPHISSFRERIQVNSRLITEEEIVDQLPSVRGWPCCWCGCLRPALHSSAPDTHALSLSRCVSADLLTVQAPQHPRDIFRNDHGIGLDELRASSLRRGMLHLLG